MRVLAQRSLSAAGSACHMPTSVSITFLSLGRSASLTILPRLVGTQSNIAMACDLLGRKEESLGVYRKIYAKAVELHGKSDERSFTATVNLSSCLHNGGHFTEAIALLRQGIPEAKNALGAEHPLTLSLCHALAQCLCDEHGASPEQIREAVALLESTLRTSQRVFGRAHPTTKGLERDLAIARRLKQR